MVLAQYHTTIAQSLKKHGSFLRDIHSNGLRPFNFLPSCSGDADLSSLPADAPQQLPFSRLSILYLTSPIGSGSRPARAGGAMRRPRNDPRALKARSAAVGACARPFVPLYPDAPPPPDPVDQFAPYLAAKLARRKRAAPPPPAGPASPPLALTPRGAPAADAALAPAAPATLCAPSPKLQCHARLEAAFDGIASRCLDAPLSALVRDHLQGLFDADAVSYYHEVESVRLLYCPTSGAVCPHGCGLVGYAGFARRVVCCAAARDHVGYSAQYDGRYHDPGARILAFPVCDHANRLKGVVAVARAPSKAPFAQELAAVDYLQRKFLLYSRFLFSPAVSDADVAGVFQIARVAAFVEGTGERLARLFSCRAAEIWLYERDRGEIRQYSAHSGVPLPVSPSESGIAGYALQNACSVSLVTVNNHAAFHAPVDGPPDQSIFALPVSDPEMALVYAIVLRGKQRLAFFTDTDEKVLVKIAPLVITALKACESIESGVAAMEEMNRGRMRLQSLLEGAELLSGQLHLPRFVATVMARACHLVNADRCHLFAVNNTRDRLIAWDHTGRKSEAGILAGIVGVTVSVGQRVNVKDAQEDPRIDHTSDLETGYRTQTILCIPIFDINGLVIGATQLINKYGGVFTDEDEKVIELFNVFVGVCLQNALSYQTCIDLAMEISESPKLDVILRQARRIVGAGRALIFTLMANGSAYELLALDEDTEARVARIDRVNRNALSGLHNAKKALVHRMLNHMSKDKLDDAAQAKEDSERLELALAAAQTHGRVIRNIEDPPEDSMVAVPVADGGFVVAVVLLQWKHRDTGFVPADGELLERLVPFFRAALARHPAHAVIHTGITDFEMRKALTDSERAAFSPPVHLKLEAGEAALLISKGFRISEFMEIDGNLHKIAFHLLHRIAIREKFPFSNETFFKFIFEVQQQSGDRWPRALECACHLVHILVNGVLLTIFQPIETFVMFLVMVCHQMDVRRLPESPPPEIFAFLLRRENIVDSGVCQTVMRLLAKPECGLLSGLDEQNAEYAWGLFTDLLLSLNWSAHLRLMNELHELPKLEKWQASKEGRAKVMMVLLKTATMADAVLWKNNVDAWSEQVLRDQGIQLFATDVKDKAALFDVFCEPLSRLVIQLFPSLASSFSFTQ
jgi:hypothetical protein